MLYNRGGGEMKTEAAHRRPHIVLQQRQAACFSFLIFQHYRLCLARLYFTNKIFFFFSTIFR